MVPGGLSLQPPLYADFMVAGVAGTSFYDDAKLPTSATISHSDKAAGGGS